MFVGVQVAGIQLELKHVPDFIISFRTAFENSQPVGETVRNLFQSCVPRKFEETLVNMVKEAAKSAIMANLGPGSASTGEVKDVVNPDTRMESLSGEQAQDSIKLRNNPAPAAAGETPAPVQPTFNDAVAGNATGNEKQPDGLAPETLIHDLQPQDGVESPHASNDSPGNGVVDGNGGAQGSKHSSESHEGILDPLAAATVHGKRPIHSNEEIRCKVEDDDVKMETLKRKVEEQDETERREKKMKTDSDAIEKENTRLKHELARLQHDLDEQNNKVEELTKQNEDLQRVITRVQDCIDRVR